MGSNGHDTDREIKLEYEDADGGSEVGAPISLEIPDANSPRQNKRLRRARQVLDPSPRAAPSPSASAAGGACASNSAATSSAGAGATATVTITARPIDLPLMLGTIASPSPRISQHQHHQQQHTPRGGAGLLVTPSSAAAPTSAAAAAAAAASSGNAAAAAAIAAAAAAAVSPHGSSSADCNVTDPKTGEVESLEQYMTCRKCGSVMRAVMRRHRVNGSLIQFPALRCTKKGCQTFKSLRAISGEVMPRTFVHSEERGDEEARACLLEWRNKGKSTDDGIRGVMNQVKNRLVYEKKSIDKRIRIINELQTWFNDLPPALKRDMTLDQILETEDASSLTSPSAMGGRSLPDHLVHLLKWDSDRRIRVELTNVPDGYWSAQDFEPCSEEDAEEQRALLSEASRQTGVNLDGLSDCCRQTARRSALLPSIDPLLSAEVFSREAIEAAAPSPSDSAGDVFKTLLNQKKKQSSAAAAATTKGGITMAAASAAAATTTQHHHHQQQGGIGSGSNSSSSAASKREARERDSAAAVVESILAMGQQQAAAAEMPNLVNSAKAKRAKSDIGLIPAVPAGPRPYNSLSRGLELQRKRSGLLDDAPPPIKAWKKVNGEWRPMDVDDPVVQNDEQKLAEFRARLEKDETWRGKRRAQKEEARERKKRRLGDEDAYRDWIIEERARMAQLAEIERDMDEHEMLKEDFDASAPTLETPRKRSMRKKELEKRLADLAERKNWMENELDERRKEMALVKANIDAACAPQDLREALSLAGQIDVNTLLLSISSGAVAAGAACAAPDPDPAEEEYEEDDLPSDEAPPTLSANDTIAGLLAKIKTPC